MQKRGWVLLVIGFLLLAMTVLVWWAGRKPNDAAMALLFIGYTNSASALYGMSDLPKGLNVTLGVLLATNTGSVPVELWAAVSARNAWMPGFAPPVRRNLPRVMKPGESMSVYVTIDPNQHSWWTEFGYQRHGLRDRLLGRAWNSGNRTIQSWIGPLISDFYFVKCGPITNQPPDIFFHQRFLEPFDPFLKFAEPPPSVRFLQPPIEDLLIETNTPVRRPTNGL